MRLLHERSHVLARLGHVEHGAWTRFIFAPLGVALQ